MKMNEEPTAVECLCSSDSGYTLIELIISAGILALMLTGLYTVLFQTQATYDAQQDSMALLQEARAAVDNLAFEMRMAGSKIDTAPEAVEIASPTQVAFAVDIDDGSPLQPCGAVYENAVDGGAERITYRVQGTQMLRDVDCWDGSNWHFQAEASNAVVVGNLTAAGPVFRFFDENGTELLAGGGPLSAAQREDLRMISIDVTLEDAENHAVAETLEGMRIFTQVKLRNRGG
jgi:prepilin-type N-terminal cleavage/methylation domain-containing protein